MLGIMRKSMLLLILLSVGCSMEASIQNLENGISEILQHRALEKELVPASQQGVVTAAGYYVQSSMSYHKGPMEVTTAQGYRVRTNVQATIFKE